MNLSAPFQASDLEELDARLLARAERVVPMRDVFKGDTGPRVIGLRHDVDGNRGSFDAALAMAEWEFERGYSSTYYLLHSADYWERALAEAETFEELGHEVGLHVNAIAEAIRRRIRDPHVILAEALGELCASGVRIVGSVAHGDPLCRRDNGQLAFVNDEVFAECVRMGDRHYEGVHIYGLPRARYGLEYDANWLSRAAYLSDSGGEWSQAFSGVVQGFGEGQLHMLIHPDWWVQAFERVAA